MVTYLLKKSYQHKTYKEIYFKDLWGDNGVFTTMWIFGKPTKILFFKKHIKNLIKSLKVYKLDTPNLEKNIIKLIFSVSFIYIFGLLWLGFLIGWDKPIFQLGAYPFLLAELFKMLILAYIAGFFYKVKKII